MLETNAPSIANGVVYALFRFIGENIRFIGENKHEKKFGSKKKKNNYSYKKMYVKSITSIFVRIECTLTIVR